MRKILFIEGLSLKLSDDVSKYCHECVSPFDTTVTLQMYCEPSIHRVRVVDFVPPKQSCGPVLCVSIYLNHQTTIKVTARDIELLQQLLKPIVGQKTSTSDLTSGVKSKTIAGGGDGDFSHEGNALSWPWKLLVGDSPSISDHDYLGATILKLHDPK